MSRQHAKLGTLLTEIGRITPDQVDAALAHQREHGGFFGDALIRLGFLGREELRWILARQYDLPFVHLRPENIDLSLAALVPAEWARANHILPVLRDGGRVVAVVGDVTRLELLDELGRMMGASVEAALADPAAIRDLVAAVYGPVAPRPASLGDLLREAVDGGAGSVGLSARGDRAVGWYQVVERVQRPLLEGWRTDLRAVLSDASPVLCPAGPGHRRWNAVLSLPGSAWRVRCEALGQGDALEWAARDFARLAAQADAPPVDPDVRASILRASATGGTLVAVEHTGDEGADARVADALPLLPAHLLGAADTPLSVHISDTDLAQPAWVLALAGRPTVSAALGSLAGFAPQAISVDVSAVSGEDVAALRAAAPLVVVRTRSGPLPVGSADITIRLRMGAGGYTWKEVRHGDGLD